MGIIHFVRWLRCDVLLPRPPPLRLCLLHLPSSEYIRRAGVRPDRIVPRQPHRRRLLPGDPGSPQRLGGLLLAIATPFGAYRMRSEKTPVVGPVGGRLVTHVNRKTDPPCSRMIVKRHGHGES